MSATCMEQTQVFPRLLLHYVSLALAIHLSLVAATDPCNVSYDNRAITINGVRRVLTSGSIHYPRATPEMWPDLIAKSKEGGLDVIESYFFWNVHEPVQGQFNFEGNYDIVRFINLVAQSGLYFHLRIGPYACAEWNFGGFPVWLRDIPGIEFRTDNEPFKAQMQRIVTKVVEMMKAAKLFSWQGGPIIMLQIENEYGNVEGKYGKKGKNYVQWAAKMAVGLDAGVPWVMCRQPDAPDIVINTCNGFYCDSFRPRFNSKPIIWTEDWDGWYKVWGGKTTRRPVEDSAYAVARFLERGGTFHNYYMYFGGTNFGRTSGGPLVTTSYDYDAPIDEYGLLRQPKWGHLRDLHAAIKLCEAALVSVNSPLHFNLGPNQEADVYSPNVNTSSKCAAFLANYDEKKTANVTIFGRSYTLPPWSVSILPDCNTEAFNTAKVGAQTSIKEVRFNLPLNSNDSSNPTKWEFFSEPLSIWGNSSFTTSGILKHLNVTKDQSDYLWYSTRLNVSHDDISYWKNNDITPKLMFGSIRDVACVLVNRKVIGCTHGQWIPWQQPVHFLEGSNDLVLLTELVGLQNYGAFFDQDDGGLRGQLTLTGFKRGDIDLSTFNWTYQVGLYGESLGIYSKDNINTVNWSELLANAIPSKFVWFRTFFDAPTGTEPVVLNLASMGKGQAWVNGHHIGRFWTLNAPVNGCPSSCLYKKTFHVGNCQTSCGNITQPRYFVPRSWLQSSNNILVILEETGGNPFQISLGTVSTGTICAQMSEYHTPSLSKWSSKGSTSGRISLLNTKPELSLQCDDGHIISSIDFASYGTPQGSCQSFSTGTCHASKSFSVMSKACLGNTACTVEASNASFGDPCRGVVKTLSVQAKCTPSSSIN